MLSPNQARCLCLIAAGRSREEAAKETGVSVSTVDKWSAKAEFREMLNKAVSEVFDAALAELVSSSQLAARELKNIILDPDVPSRTKVSAIQVLLSNAAHVKNYILESRIEAIESSLNGDLNPTEDSLNDNISE